MQRKYRYLLPLTLNVPETVSKTKQYCSLTSMITAIAIGTNAATSPHFGEVLNSYVFLIRIYVKAVELCGMDHGPQMYCL